MPTAPSAQGIWMQRLQPAACDGVSGASEAPKSTVRALICAIPAPDPTPAYVTLSPYRRSKSIAQAASSGATSVDPAPVSEAALATVEPKADPAIRHVLTAAATMIENLLRFKCPPRGRICAN